MPRAGRSVGKRRGSVEPERQGYDGVGPAAGVVVPRGRGQHAGLGFLQAPERGLLVEEEKGIDDFAYQEARVRSEEYDTEYLERMRREIWERISKPKLRTDIGNKDIYYAILEPFVDRFPEILRKSP